MLWWQGAPASHWPHWAVTGIPSTTTMLAHGRLLVDDPERIGPVQANGMDQTLFNRVGSTHPALGDHVRLP